MTKQVGTIGPNAVALETSDFEAAVARGEYVTAEEFFKDLLAVGEPSEPVAIHQWRDWNEIPWVDTTPENYERLATVNVERRTLYTHPSGEQTDD